MSKRHDDYFMGVAKLSAEMSHCTRRKVGAVLVRDNFIIATGRNGTLPNLPNDCECLADGELVTNEFTLHAEQNALLFCAKRGIPTDGTILYVTTSPCKTCAKLIAAGGIKEVIIDELYKDRTGIAFLRNVGIKVRFYNEEVSDV